MAGSKTKRTERFSVFHIPKEVLDGLYIPAPLNTHVQLQTTDEAGADTKPASHTSHYSTPAATADTQLSRVFASARQAKATCHTCGGIEFGSAEKQRAHHRTEVHAVNMARKVAWRKANPGAMPAADEYPWQPVEALSDDSESDEGSVWGESDASAVEEDESDDRAKSAGPGRGVKATMDAETLAQELDTQASSGRTRDDATSSDEDADGDAGVRGKDSKLAQWLWFASGSQTPEESSGPTTVYGIHRRVLVQRGQHGVHTSGAQILHKLGQMQHPPMPPRSQAQLKAPAQTHMSEQSSVWILLALAGGFFAGAVFDNRSGQLLAHKTIQRYTTRRKQGGSQAKQDNAMGRAAQSAGAQIRRYNEQKLHEEIRSLMAQWHEYLRQSALVFVRVPTRESRVFFGPSSRSQATGQAMLASDPRIRAVPVAMARPSLAELQRVYGELSTVRMRTIDAAVLSPGSGTADNAADDASVASAQSDAQGPAADEDGSGDGESEHTLDAEPRPDLLAFLHHVAKMLLNTDLTDSHIVAYLEQNMRQLLDALSDPAVGLRYLQDTDTIQAHRTPTLLHLACLTGRSELLPYLIDHGEDPTVTNGYAPLYTGGLTAYEVAADQPTRDALFAYRVENAGDRDNPIDWERSRVPDPTAVKEKEDRAREKKRKERERRKAREKAKKEQKSRDEQQALSAAADDQALDQAVRENEKIQKGKTAEWKRGIDSMTQAELKMRMLSMAHASADAWKVPRTVGSSLASSSQQPERPLSPGAQRARDRELRFQAFERRRQNAAPAPKPAGPTALSGECTHCGRQLRGLVPFEQFDWKCCSVKCLQDHKNSAGM